jgi:hypothetical protein
MFILIGLGGYVALHYLGVDDQLTLAVTAPRTDTPAGVAKVLM